MNWVMLTGFLLLAVGLWGLLTQRNLIKMIVAFSIMDTGVHLVIVAVGYIKGKTAPILDNSSLLDNTAHKVVDAIPSALVLTAIVIGLAVTGLLLAFAVRLYRQKKTLHIDAISELKW